MSRRAVRLLGGLLMASLVGASSGATAYDGTLPPSGYAARLLGAFRQEKRAGALRVEVSPVPVAYRYLMARGMEELERAGYEGSRLRAKLHSLHRKYARYRGKLFLEVRIRSEGKNVHSFLTAPLSRLFRIEQKGRKTLAPLGGKKPVFARWQVYEIRPNIARKIFKVPLSRFDRLRRSFVSTTVKLDRPDPVTLSIRGITTVSHTGGIQSVNTARRQISCAIWRELDVGTIEIPLYPGRWKKEKLPRPPAGFDELLESLAKG